VFVLSYNRKRQRHTFRLLKPFLTSL